MSKTATVNARLEPNVKNKAENILRALGLRHSDAISMFYHQMILNEGLPFEAKIPNKKTLQAIKEDVSQNKKYKNASEMMAGVLK